MCIHRLNNTGSYHCSVPPRTPEQAADDRRAAKKFYWGAEPDVKSPITWDPLVSQRETSYMPKFPADIPGTGCLSIPTPLRYNSWLPRNKDRLSEQIDFPVMYFYTPTHMLPSSEYNEVEQDKKSEKSLEELGLSVVRFLDL